MFEEYPTGKRSMSVDLGQETGYALDQLAKAIRNDPPYAMRLVLSDGDIDHSWSLFALETNVSYDRRLPGEFKRTNDEGHEVTEGGGTYFLTLNASQPRNYSNVMLAVHQQVFMSPSDVLAVQGVLLALPELRERYLTKGEDNGQ